MGDRIYYLVHWMLKNFENLWPSDFTNYLWYAKIENMELIDKNAKDKYFLEYLYPSVLVKAVDMSLWFEKNIMRTYYDDYGIPWCWNKAPLGELKPICMIPSIYYHLLDEDKPIKWALDETSQKDFNKIFISTHEYAVYTCNLLRAELQGGKISKQMIVCIF